MSSLSRVLCPCCEGTGRINPHPYEQSTMRCPEGCDNGTFPAMPKDLDGQRAGYGGAFGTLFIYHGTLALETEDGVIVVNLKVEDVS